MGSLFILHPSLPPSLPWSQARQRRAGGVPAVATPPLSSPLCTGATVARSPTPGAPPVLSSPYPTAVEGSVSRDWPPLSAQHASTWALWCCEVMCVVCRNWLRGCTYLYGPVRSGSSGAVCCVHIVSKIVAVCLENVHTITCMLYNNYT